MKSLLSKELELADSSHARLPGRITHLVLNRATSPYHFLHECSLVHFRDRFYTAWNACGKSESDRETVIRWTSWDEMFRKNDGLREIRPALRIDDVTNWESCQLFEYRSSLYALVGQVHCQPHDPVDNGGRTVLFRLMENKLSWEEVCSVAGFQPLNPPISLPDGRLLCGGEFNLHEPRVMISASSDLTCWRVIPLSCSSSAVPMFPETALMPIRNGIRAFVRSGNHGLLTADSTDGEHWEMLDSVDFPASSSKMCAGRLSSGEGYLILNSPSADLPDTRSWLRILLTEPGRDTFCRQVTIRNSRSPLCRDERSHSQWSYPCAVEFGDSFYVAYSISKEDYGLSILPLSELQTINSD